VAVTRWKIEEDHPLAEQVARLDSGQVTTWTSWHRWTANSLPAYAAEPPRYRCATAV
jgi:hypothetical protein